MKPFWSRLGISRRVLLSTLALLPAMSPWAAMAQENPVTAIDIALEPDAKMIKHAEAANARLRKVHPEGYALDATHRPHITMLQRFVRTADLDKVYAAVGSVLTGEKPAGWTLKAFKYYYVVWDKAGVTVILIEPTNQLIQFQQKLIDVVAPFTVETGTAAAFFTTPEHPDINKPTIDYVAHYVPNSSGKKGRAFTSLSCSLCSVGGSHAAAINPPHSRLIGNPVAHLREAFAVAAHRAADELFRH